MQGGRHPLEGQCVGRGRFRLHQALDRGGFGAVFAAVDLSDNRRVAVKVLHTVLGEDEVQLARFRREAEITARLSHPHVVQVISTGGGPTGDQGEDEGEGEPPFIVMELLAGGSLQARLAQGEVFDTARTVRIARQILSALEAAHAIGVVHRDLKPGNVMLLDGPDGDLAKLVDFGVARLVTSNAITRLTQTGHVVGTPSYMAPEQAMGEPGSPCADVYAVGAIMHRLLVGTPPYGRGRYADILTRMAGGDRDRTTGFGLVGDIIERGLAFDPGKRFATAREFSDALAPHDPTAATTITEWMPPVDLAALRLSAEPALPRLEDAAAVQAAAVTTGTRQSRGRAAAPPPSETGSARRLVPLAVVLLLALAVGITGTYLWLRPASAPSAGARPPANRGAQTGGVAGAGSAAPVAPVALVPPMTATPNPIGVADAGRSADAEDTAADSGPETASPARSAPHHRTPRRRALVARFSGGAFPGRIQDVLRRQLGALDYTSCWPAADPYPRSELGSTFILRVDPAGVVRDANAHNDTYPAFNACVVRLFEGRRLETHFDQAHEMRVSVNFYPVRRR